MADPYVVRAGSSLYMYYLGQDRARRQRLGVAMSTDGFHWRKLRANPVLELGSPGSFDEVGLGEPAVWPDRGSYWMFYTASTARESAAAIGAMAGWRELATGRSCVIRQ